MDLLTLAALEFEAMKRLIAPFVRTPPGRRALEALAPSSDPVAVTARKRLAEEAMRHHLEGGRLGPGGLEDPDPVLERLAPSGAVLEPIEIARLVSVMQAADAARQDLGALRERYPRIWEVASRIPDLRGATRPIAGKISADGRLEDAASSTLARVRLRILDLEGRLQRALQSILDRSAGRGHLQEAYVTIRNGRFVLPVRAEARSSVPGIVHGSSGTGATVFVEPMETIELNNELVTLRDEELAEIRRILSEWSDLLRSRLAEIRTARDLLAELDLLGAIGVFGVEYRCAIAGQAGAEGPPRGRAARLFLDRARHPLLEAGLRPKEADPVPLTFEMPAGGGALILSGPNAGGKTVALKTIGLLALMNQAGLPVPAEEAEIPIFRQVVADIGDHQSILESLSTFSARMVRVAGMSRALSTPALVLLDELAAGTDPEEAGALAVAIVDHFRRRGAAVVATTHHEALKAYAETAEGAANAAMEIDERTMRPTYRLVAGTAGRSGGIDLAERVGMPEEVVADARSRLSEGHRETRAYMARLRETAEAREREEEALGRQRAGLEAQRVELDRSHQEALAAAREGWRAATESALRQIEEARERFLAGIRDRAVELQIRAEARRQSRTLREQLEQAIAPAAPGGSAEPSAAASPPAIRPGMRVKIQGAAGTGEIATVESVDARGRAAILVRGKRVTVRAEDLTPHEGAREGERKAPWTLPAGVRFEPGDRGPAPSEINLIGATVEEALDRLDRFLDDAYLAGHGQVRIVHGHGTGRLRSAIHRMLKDHPHVASHAPAGERAGGSGATVAVLRD